MNLVATPVSLFTFRFRLEAGGVELGWVRHRAFHRGGQVELGGMPLTISRPGRGWYRLEGPDGSVEVTAVRTGMREAYLLEDRRHQLQLERRGFRWMLFSGGDTVGAVRLRNLFERTLLVEVPDGTSTEMLALLVWLVIRSRRRAAAVAAGGG